MINLKTNFSSSILVIASFFHPHPHPLGEKMHWIRSCVYLAWLFIKIIRINKKDKIA